MKLCTNHCKLNPIEMAWVRLKGYIRVHNTKFIVTHVKELTLVGFAHIGSEEWEMEIGSTFGLGCHLPRHLRHVVQRSGHY